MAVPCLEALTQVTDIVAAVCQPDRPAGRGLQQTQPAIKKRADELGIRAVQPNNLRDGQLLELIRSAEVDLGVVLAYGRLLPPDLLAAPKYGCVNLHASLLPRHRGAAPIQWTIIVGDAETGVSLMQMNAGLDTGPVLVQHQIAVDARETGGTLTERISLLCAEITRTQIPRLLLG